MAEAFAIAQSGRRGPVLVDIPKDIQIASDELTPHLLLVEEQVARPDNTVTCVSGDGWIMMNIQELGTIKRKKLPVKILLLDN